MHKFTTVALAWSLGMPVAAEQPLPPIVISAARTLQPGIRTTASTQVIERAEIIRSGAPSLTDLLRGLKGIHVSDLFGDGSNSTLDMRGFGSNAASNTLVIVDGRRINPSSDSASLYLNRIDLQRVERIEIIQGSAGVLFGNQAVGGVINIITSRPDRLQARGEVAAGSFDRREVKASLSNRADNGLGIDLNVSHRRSDNYRDHNTAQLDRASLQLDYESADNHVWFAVETFREDTETPGALFLDELNQDRRRSAPIYANDRIDTDSQLYRLGVRQVLNPHWRFEGEISYADDARDFVQSFRTFAGPDSTQDREIWDFSPRLIGRLGTALRPTHITLGMDYQRTDYALFGLGPQEVDQRVMAWYGQLITALGDDTDVSLGLRHAKVRNALLYEDFSVFPSTLAETDIDDSVTIGAIGLVHALNPDVELFARANQNYRFAKVDEHTNPVFGQPVGLDTQTGITYEAGVRLDRGDLKADLTLYRIDLDDEIHFDASGFANVNIESSRRTGLLGTLDARLGRAGRVGASYNYTDSEATGGAFKGEHIPLVPEHKLRLFGEYRPLPTLRLMVEGLYVSEQYYGGDFANRHRKMADYAVLNLNASYERGPWRFNLRINNLGDEEYSETGNIGSDNLAHPDCIANGFGGFNCPAENPAPGINAWLSASYQYE